MVVCGRAVREPGPAVAGHGRALFHVDARRLWRRAAYIAVPHKNDLDLGRNLVIAFAEELAPAHLQAIESFFRHKGAYAKFKALLERTELLQRWYEYEATATSRALEAWATANGFTVVKSDGGA